MPMGVRLAIGERLFVGDLVEMQLQAKDGRECSLKFVKPFKLLATVSANAKFTIGPVVLLVSRVIAEGHAAGFGISAPRDMKISHGFEPPGPEPDPPVTIPINRAA